MKLSISVMAHPSREKFIPYLKEKLGDIPVSMDNGIGIWENCKNAWRLHDKTADYHVVIQDDAIIGKDFYNKAIKEISEHPGKAFSFYFGNRKTLEESAKRAEQNNGIEMGWISWGVAICLPIKIIPDMIQYCDKLPLRLKKHDDTMIANFLRYKKITTWYPIPSLVDHRLEKSLVETDKSKGRKAYKFIGE